MHVIHWPINPEAPFDFSEMPALNLYRKEDFNLDGLFAKCIELNPEIVVVSGWRDKEYMQVIKRGIPGKKVISLDNPWRGNLKQRIWTLMSRFKILPYFSHAWVAGERQRKYARKLGFREDRIISKLYSADNALFESIYVKRKNRNLNGTRRFIYVGRYSDEKNIDMLFSAFQHFHKSNFNWELWCLGTGPKFKDKVEGNGIKHFGFVQPEDMEEILLESDVFVLPSKFEPWGLVVHEMAAAGFPLIISEQVGAKEVFLGRR